MKIAGVYSVVNGEEAIKAHYSTQWAEITYVIAQVDTAQFKSQNRVEKPAYPRRLIKSDSLSAAFDREFQRLGWQSNVCIQCDYAPDHYTAGYAPPPFAHKAHREMKFVNNRLGVEVQFGIFGPLVYDICAKMTIFHKAGLIDAGMQIVPLKELADNMAAGTTYFEQIVWDLEHRGASNIDIPVMILGIRA